MFQKPGSLFRFYVLRLADLLNSRHIRAKAEAIELRPRYNQDRDYAKKKAAHDLAVRAAEESGKSPDVPPCYLSKDDPATHVDVGAFKELWDAKLRYDPEVVASRAAGVKYTKKDALRRALMDAAMGAGVIKTRSALRV